jgi:glutathione peroxidase
MNLHSISATLLIGCIAAPVSFAFGSEPAKPAAAPSSTPAATPKPETKDMPKDASPTQSTPAGVLDLNLTDIDGKAYDLAQHKGKVVMLVNVASECGLTPQYAALEKLHDTYAEQGLVIIGLPCNDFRDQEPGTESEIKAFCSSKYGVSFPMMSKVKIKGASRSPIYEYIIKQPAPIGGKEPAWNFTKFIVSREGKIVERVEPQTSPSDPKVVARVEALLKEKPPATDAKSPADDPKLPAPAAGSPATPPKK